MAESTLYEAHPSMFRNHPLYFVLSVLLIAAFGVGLLILLGWWIAVLGTTLTVTDERITLRRGLLSKHTSEVFHSDVRNVQIDQTFGQRIFGVGTIGVSSSGQSGVEIQVAGIPDPQRIKDLIDAHRRPKG